MKKRMSKTKVMKNLRDIRSLLIRMHNNGNIIGAVTEADEALTEAIRLVKMNGKAFEEGIEIIRNSED